MLGLLAAVAASLHRSLPLELLSTLLTVLLQSVLGVSTTLPPLAASLLLPGLLVPLLLVLTLLSLAASLLLPRLLAVPLPTVLSLDVLASVLVLLALLAVVVGPLGRSLGLLELPAALSARAVLPLLEGLPLLVVILPFAVLTVDASFPRLAVLWSPAGRGGLSSPAIGLATGTSASLAVLLP